MTSQSLGPKVVEATYLADLSQPAFAFWSKDGNVGPLLLPGGDRVPIPWPITTGATAQRNAVLVALPEALKALSGETQLDATAILDYFAPLKQWLDEQNKDHKIGW